MSDYPFRTTYKQDDNTYVEDRGYPHFVRKGDSDFSTLKKEFGNILKVGQSAEKDSNGDWEVKDTFGLLERTKSELKEILDKAWNEAEAHSFVDSVIGFTIDANDRANRDINALITGLDGNEEAKILFCAADNSFHQVNLEQLKTMRMELIQKGQEIYSLKWQYRTEIEESSNIEELMAMKDSIKSSFATFILNK